METINFLLLLAKQNVGSKVLYRYPNRYSLLSTVLLHNGHVQFKRKNYFLLEHVALQVKPGKALLCEFPPVLLVLATFALACSRLSRSVGTIEKAAKRRADWGGEKHYCD